MNIHSFVDVVSPPCSCASRLSWPPCSFSADRHCEQPERHTGQLRAELLHRSQTFHHLRHRGRRHRDARTRWAREENDLNPSFPGNNAHVSVSVQEKQRIYPTPLKVHQHRSEPSVLHFTTDFGRTMDGKSFMTGGCDTWR